MDDDTLSGGLPATYDQRSTAAPGGQPRYFFPCNREDALLLLGGLCISRWFPEMGVHLAVQGSEIALVSEGLRSDEAELICGPSTERFPILLEVATRVIEQSPRLLRPSDVVSLVFRSQDEADAFRYRPVDEFDPVDLPWRVEPELFGLPEIPRFRLRSPSEGEEARIGQLADRIAGGLAAMVEFGNRLESSRETIGRFINGHGLDPSQPEIELSSFIQSLVRGSDGAKVPFLSEILAAFTGSTGGTPREVIDKLEVQFKAVIGSKDRAGEVASRWLEVAKDVARGRIELNGDLLSDEKAILLRAALLAAFAADIKGVLAFMVAEKPAGHWVSTVASFLVGLKTGIVGDSWDNKKARADKLAAVISELLRSSANLTVGSGPLVQATQLATDEGTIRSLSIGEVVFAEWTSPVQAEGEQDQALRDELASAGYLCVGAGRIPGSLRARLPGSEREVDVRYCQAGNASNRFPVFTFHLTESGKLRSTKEITQSFQSGGHLWTARKSAESGWLLSCELVALPSEDSLRILVETLEDAIKLCVASGKVGRKSRPKTAVSKLLESEPAGVGNLGE